MTIFFALETTPIGLLGVLATGTSSLTRLSLDEKVNEEKAGKECSEENGEVGAELDLEGKGVGGHGLNDGVKGEGRGREGSNGEGTDGGLGGDIGDLLGHEGHGGSDKGEEGGVSLNPQPVLAGTLAVASSTKAASAAASASEPSPSPSRPFLNCSIALSLTRQICCANAGSKLVSSAPRSSSALRW